MFLFRKSVWFAWTLCAFTFCLSAPTLAQSEGTESDAGNEAVEPALEEVSADEPAPSEPSDADAADAESSDTDASDVEKTEAPTDATGAAVEAQTGEGAGPDQASPESGGDADAPTPDEAAPTDQPEASAEQPEVSSDQPEEAASDEEEAEMADVNEVMTGILEAMGLRSGETQEVHEFTLTGGLLTPIPDRDYGANYSGEEGFFVELGWVNGKRKKSEEGALGGFSKHPDGLSLRYAQHTAVVQAAALGVDRPDEADRQVSFAQLSFLAPQKVLLTPLSAGPLRLRASVSGGGGLAKMDVPTALSSALGGTGTELGDASGKWKLSLDSSFNVSLGLRPTDASGALRFSPSAYYAYSLTSVESDFRFWRYLGHQALTDTGFGIVGLIAQVPFKDKPLLKNLVQLAVAGAAEWVEYEVFYDPHNWPWDDPAPMQFSQHQFGVTFLY